MSGRGRIVLLGLLALLAIVWLVAWLVETDAEAIERIVQDCRAAFLAGDADTLVAHMTDDATAGGFVGEGDLRPLTRTWVSRASERLTGASLNLKTEIEVDGDEARGSWGAIVRFKPTESIPAARFTIRIRFLRSPEGWRIRRAEVTSP